MTPPSTTPPAPVRVGVLDEVDLVVAGLSTLLAAHVDAVELTFLRSGGASAPVDGVEALDVVLCDPFLDPAHSDRALARIRLLHPARVVVFTWQHTPIALRRSLDAGAHGLLSKSVGVVDLLRALDAALHGERLPDPSTAPAVAAVDDDDLVYEGLTLRESQILTLLCRGLSNQEIGAALYVSVNSVKTYVRQVYAKIGVNRRTQAVAWAHRQGFRG